MNNRTTVERKSERELVVTRTFDGPADLGFEAWTKPELFKRWWVPKSMGMSLLSCEEGCGPCRCAFSAITIRRCKSPPLLTSIPELRSSTIRGFPRTRSTRWPALR